jgi:hypothetical protein
VVLKVAVTLVLAAKVTVQVPVPEHPPPVQPANVEPELGVAVSVTAVPLAKLALQACPQLMPEGLLVTVPVPVPLSCTVSCTGGMVDVLKAAETLVPAETSTVQLPVPLHAPVQPANVEPELAAAVSVTDVPLAKVALHVCPQLMPAGVLVTIPVPVPLLWTVSGKSWATKLVLVPPQPLRIDNIAAQPNAAAHLFLEKVSNIRIIPGFPISFDATLVGEGCMRKMYSLRVPLDQVADSLRFERRIAKKSPRILRMGRQLAIDSSSILSSI